MDSMMTKCQVRLRDRFENFKGIQEFINLLLVAIRVIGHAEQQQVRRATRHEYPCPQAPIIVYGDDLDSLVAAELDVRLRHRQGGKLNHQMLANRFDPFVIIHVVFGICMIDATKECSLG